MGRGVQGRGCRRGGRGGRGGRGLKALRACPRRTAYCVPIWAHFVRGCPVVPAYSLYSTIVDGTDARPSTLGRDMTVSCRPSCSTPEGVLLCTSQEGRTPLWWASHNGYPEVVKELLGAGANMEAKDEVGGADAGTTRQWPMLIHALLRGCPTGPLPVHTTPMLSHSAVCGTATNLPPTLGVKFCPAVRCRTGGPYSAVLGQHERPCGGGAGAAGGGRGQDLHQRGGPWGS